MKKITKKIFILFSIVLIGMTLNAQDVVELKHTNYTSHFSKSKHYPVMVEWWITRAKVNCEKPLARKDNFKPDPLLPKETDLVNDYKGSGTDRGHMMPAAQNLCQTPAVQDECFYFSNMSPQYHSLNAGIWKTLESRTRELATEFDSVKVWCGSLGSAGKIGTVTIPTHCWKVIFIKKTKVWEAYLFENTKVQPKDLESKLTPLSKIETITRIKFK